MMPDDRQHSWPPGDDSVEPPGDDSVESPGDDSVESPGDDSVESPGDDSVEPPADDPIELPINGELDLHHFHPRDVKDLVPDYLEECRKRGILEVRIVHGKGIGALRRTVHSVLDTLPYVVNYRQGGPSGGSWGATIANLAPLENESE